MKRGLGLAVCVCLAGAQHALPAPVVDGSIGTSEGWILLAEADYAKPLIGGASGSSDAAGESSTFNWYDGLTASNVVFMDNRGDIINVYVARDKTNFYLAIAGPTVPFNSFSDLGGPSDGDQGEIYVAIDASGAEATGSLAATNAHNGFGGLRGIDFNGWTPTHILGLQYVDNGGGGGGWASLETSVTHSVLWGEGQNLNNGGFDWHGTLNSSAAYDSFNGNAGEFEFCIPWTMLGLTTNGPTPGYVVRLAAYCTQNFTNFDGYDSAPGIGNTTSFEAIGDNPGDPDSSGQLGPTDSGSFGQPGSDFTGDLNFQPSHEDGIDTIEEYLEWKVIPDPAVATSITQTASEIVTSWTAASGFVYRLEYTSDLLSTNDWTDPGMVSTAQTDTVTFTDTNTPHSQSRRTYRAPFSY